MTLEEKRDRRREREARAFRYSVSTQVFNLKANGERITALKLIRTAFDYSFSQANQFYNSTSVSNI